MDLLSILLGALLATGGGLLAQRQEQILRRQREEEDILLEANDALLKLHALLPQTDYAHLDVDAGHHTAEFVQRTLELLTLSERLNKCAVGLKRSEHRAIAVRLAKLALDPPLRTRENVFGLTREVQLRLNAKMISRYEQEISNDPAHF